LGLRDADIAEEKVGQSTPTAQGPSANFDQVAYPHVHIGPIQLQDDEGEQEKRHNDEIDPAWSCQLSNMIERGRPRFYFQTRRFSSSSLQSGTWSGPSLS
jgi:hypothetical protein